METHMHSLAYDFCVMLLLKFLVPTSMIIHEACKGKGGMVAQSV